MTAGIGLEDEIPFEHRVVAYVDVLGWTELVRLKRVEAIARRIFRASTYLTLAHAHQAERKKDFARARNPFGHTIRTSVFSDTIIYSCEANPDEAAWLAQQVQALCGVLLLNGHYTRGAVTAGDLMHDEDGTIVGRALVEAHAMERSIAKYPRLIVSDVAVPFLVGPRASYDFPNGPPQVREDFDGLSYLQMFAVEYGGKRTGKTHEFARKAKAIVEQDLASTRDVQTHPDQTRALNHRSKYHWMLSYLDDVLRAPVLRDPGDPHD
jgi:hypothetical protein